MESNRKSLALCPKSSIKTTAGREKDLLCIPQGPPYGWRWARCQLVLTAQFWTLLGPSHIVKEHIFSGRLTLAAHVDSNGHLVFQPEH